MIEFATPADFTAITALNVLAYQEFSTLLTDDHWQIMKHNITNIAERSVNATFIVYRHAGEIVGAVAYSSPIHSNKQIFQDEWASVLLLAVHPAFRGQKIAAALMRKCNELALADGVETLALFTSELMTAAQKLYVSLGFAKVAELPERLGIRYFLFTRHITSSLSLL